jgi:glucokinase
LSGVVVNFVGDIISQEKIYLENRLSRKLFKEHILRLGSNLLKQCPDEVFSGLGLATFGVYHPESKSIIQAEYLNAACNINFEKFFKEEFNIVPDIIDGTSARGVAESWRVKTKSFNSFIVINAGIGIGCFVKLTSGPLLTNRGSYNEFGHMIIKPEGELCEMGHRGCVESYAAIPALEKKLCLIEKRKTINIEEIISRYHDADAIVAEVVNVSAEYLGIAAANLINIFAPEAVILGGKIAEFGSSYLEVLKSTIRKNAISDFSKNLTCLLSEIKEEGPAWGAALTQLDKLFSGN